MIFSVENEYNMTIASTTYILIERYWPTLAKRAPREAALTKRDHKFMVTKFHFKSKLRKRMAQ